MAYAYAREELVPTRNASSITQPVYTFYNYFELFHLRPISMRVASGRPRPREINADVDSYSHSKRA